MMQVSLKYLEKKNKARKKDLESYESLRKGILLCYKPKQIPEDFLMAYLDDERQWIDIENQYHFQSFIEQAQRKKVTIYIRNQGEKYPDEENAASFTQGQEISGIIKSKSSPDGKISSNGEVELNNILGAISDTPGSQPSQEISKSKPSSEIKTKQKVESKPLIHSLQQPKLQLKRESLTPFKKKDELPDSIPSPKIEKFPQISYEVLNKGMCAICSEKQMKDAIWQCKKCDQFMLCTSCYKSQRHIKQQSHDQHHSFFQISQELLNNKINFVHVLRTFFKPEYKPNPESDQIGRWITPEDIASNSLAFVKEVWDDSDHIAQKICEKFDNWEANLLTTD